MIIQFIQDEEGATSIEYALIAAIVSVGIITALTVFAEALSSVFNRVSTTVDAVH